MAAGEGRRHQSRHTGHRDHLSNPGLAPTHPHHRPLRQLGALHLRQRRRLACCLHHLQRRTHDHLCLQRQRQPHPIRLRWHSDLELRLQQRHGLAANRHATRQLAMAIRARCGDLDPFPLSGPGLRRRRERHHRSDGEDGHDDASVRRGRLVHTEGHLPRPIERPGQPEHLRPYVQPDIALLRLPLAGQQDLEWPARACRR
jgi:hypothetical protein